MMRTGDIRRRHVVVGKDVSRDAPPQTVELAEGEERREIARARERRAGDGWNARLGQMRRVGGLSETS